MNNKSFWIKNIFNIGGIVVAFVAIIAGVIIANSDIYIGDYTSFGADFYTYIYNVTRCAGNAINNVSGAIGTALVFVGLIAACFFGNNIVSCKRKEETQELLEAIATHNETLNTSINKYIASQQANTGSNEADIDQ